MTARATAHSSRSVSVSERVTVKRVTFRYCWPGRRKNSAETREKCSRAGPIRRDSLLHFRDVIIAAIHAAFGRRRCGLRCALADGPRLGPVSSNERRSDVRNDVAEDETREDHRERVTALWD